MSEILNHLEYIKLLMYIYITVIIVTYIIHRFFGREKWAKYGPGFLLIVVGVYGFIKLLTDNFWVKGVKNMMIILIGSSGGILGLLFGLLLGVYNEQKKDKIRVREEN